MKKRLKNFFKEASNGARKGASKGASKGMSKGVSKGMSEGANERLRKMGSGKLVLINHTNNQTDFDQSFLQKLTQNEVICGNRRKNPNCLPCFLAVLS